MASKTLKSAPAPAFGGRAIVVRGAREHNLKDLNLETLSQPKLALIKPALPLKSPRKTCLTRL